MKNKKDGQIEKKQKYLAELKAIKARRRGEPILTRAAPTRLEKPTVLIVCEGKNTEPSYFKKFKLTSATIRAVGAGQNTISLVEHAIAISDKDRYDQVWCVFDKDDFDANHFNAAVTKAEANGFGVAYSNQSFEYWLILHFQDHQGGPMHRSDYENTINAYLVPLHAFYDGSGSKLITENMFDILNGIDEYTGQQRVQLAITRAKRNLAQLTKGNPAAEESSTTVFKLVENILQFI